MVNPEMHAHPIILFDGVCNLCSVAVQWIIRHDKRSRFRFAALQSDTGIAMKKKYNISEAVDSIVLIENDKVYTLSDAALRVAGKCDGIWKFWYGFLIVPKFIRDAIYKWVARNRYRWFGKKNECWIPTPDLKERFLE